MEAGLIPPLIQLLNSSDQEVLLQTGRALGNICYDSRESHCVCCSSVALSFKELHGRVGEQRLREFKSGMHSVDCTNKLRLMLGKMTTFLISPTQTKQNLVFIPETGSCCVSVPPRVMQNLSSAIKIETPTPNPSTSSKFLHSHDEPTQRNITKVD